MLTHPGGRNQAAAEVMASACVAAEHHRAIVEAIENRESARAESVAHEHSRISRRNLELAFESDHVIARPSGLSVGTCR